MKSFAELLRSVLEEKDVSQAELARRIGVVQQVVNHYCTDKIKPSIDMLRTICQMLDVSSDYLLGLRSSSTS